MSAGLLLPKFFRKKGGCAYLENVWLNKGIWYLYRKLVKIVQCQYINRFIHSKAINSLACLLYFL